MSPSVRPARPSDAAAIAAIYNEGIEERQATFETRPRSAQDIASGLASGGRPFLVAVDPDVVGWARLSAYDDRECYAGVAEASVYVGRRGRGRGVGRLLLEALVEEAERSGHWKIVGLLFASNEASAALFRRAGFREVGLFHRHGRLDGEWRDVVLVERLVGEALNPRTSVSG
jgi:phosphinothricin acetyltransferase